MSSGVKRIVYTSVLVAMAAYGYVALTGPQGIPALRARWNEIRQLEEQNATLQRDNQARRERIERLKNNTDEQDIEVRKRLKARKPGETDFILPEKTNP